MRISIIKSAKSLLFVSAMVIPGVVLPAAVMVTPASAYTSEELQALSSKWAVDVGTAKKLIAGGALVLDVRGGDLKKEKPLAGAVSVEWPYFTKDTAAQKGQLLEDDAELTRRLQALGVSKDVPIVVVGDSIKGWGEDGRIVWTLRSLGHTAAYFADGGIEAITAEGPPEINPAGAGDFVVNRQAALDVTKEELKSLLGKKNVVILDTREPREFAGETPYGESRGGHVPGAQHIFYKDLLGSDGKILAPDQIKQKLAAFGVGPDTEVVSYCTGGIRSGFVTAVLNNIGVKARNYSGSMWDWSSADPALYPLEKSAN